MSEYTALVEWTRTEPEATYTGNKYSRAHVWKFDGGAEVPASSSPHSVRVPFSNPANVDPEEAFVASISSCHMLWFLSIAAQKKYVIDSYSDNAVGMMAKNEKGQLVMTRVILRPKIKFTGDLLPTSEQIEALHEAAHHECSMANSVKSEIVIESQE